MGVTVDIDTGGTFTDGFFTREGEVWTAKVETTPHDLTICFFRCLEEGAQRLGLPFRDFLLETDVLRFSSTISTNALIQRSGPRIGLLVSQGAGQSAYAETADNPILDVIVPRQFVRELPDDGVDEAFTEAVRLRVAEVLNAGARALVASLRSCGDLPGLASRERAAKEIVADDYPRHYLGAVPVLASSDLVDNPDDFRRTNTAVLNAYLHKDMVLYLYKAEEDLRHAGLVRPLLIAHGKGGVARVAKSRAIDTYNSGPVSGLMGSAWMAAQYGLSNVIAMDIGGTSTDIGIIRDGRYRQRVEGEIAGIPTCLPLIDVGAIGGGGGSIAKPRKGGGVQVGPGSAGAVPGPACYGLGGSSPTVTDANLALAILNPEAFLGGRRPLQPDRARRALEEDLAKPLNLSHHEAAALVRAELADLISEEAKRLLQEAKADLDDFVLFAYGGNGATHCCDIAARLGMSRVYTFPYNAVFSAFGSATVDVTHVYACWLGLPLADDQLKATVKAVNERLRPLTAAAERDMRSEGFDATAITYTLDLELASADGTVVDVVQHSGSSVRSAKVLGQLLQSFEQQTGSSAHGGTLRGIALRATCPVPHPALSELPEEGPDPTAARSGEKPVYWDSEAQSTPIYQRALLKPGNVVQGPAIVEAEDTTYVVPADWTFRIDRRLSGIFDRIR